jgi:hypothetical protein
MFKKIYGFFREDIETGEIEGYVENSFSMSWNKTHVRAWREIKWSNGKTTAAYKNPEGYLNQYLKSDKSGKYRYFIVRISGKSNITVNLARGKDKYSSRNKPFSVVKELK